MRTRFITGLVLAAALVLPAALYAHAGHVHKLMGTVTTRQADRVELKTPDGKTVTVILNAKTTFVRGKLKLDESAVKVGERLVVEIVGEKDMTAKAVTLGAAPLAAAK